MSAAYLDALKSVVRVMDAMETYTVSHSDLIAKYCRGIAEEMGLPDAGAIETAGYLHDVGMTVLPASILLKNGRYDKAEYEAMKSHAELGYAMVESITDPPGVASIIRYHHERWDGWGYPEGKREKDIPIGARILAVADTFNAKVSSRNYREGLPFDKALADVTAAAGVQFDPDVVAAFVRWWQKKRVACIEADTLEPCWEMKCCPAEIARTCPAFINRSGVCYWHSDVRCELHGDKCSTCIVNSEHAGRWKR
jgi:putative nucleotidyltransferase with HDIG domain